jgi:ribosomal-protein-alanine N-acetyltransferase
VLDEGSLDNIAVDPAYRRQGVAQALLEALIAQGQAQRLSFITLEVREHNAPAIGLYEKNGFQVVGRRKNYYEKPREDAILMTLTLEGRN